MSTLRDVILDRLALIKLAKHLQRKRLITSEEICKYADADAACLTVTYEGSQEELDTEIENYCRRENLVQDCTWTDDEESSSVVIELRRVSESDAEEFFGSEEF